MHPFSTSWKRQKTVSFQGGKKGCIGNEWVTKNPSHRKYRNNVPTEVSQSWNIPWARMNRMSLCENLVLSFSKPQPVLFITQYRFCFWVLLQQKHAKILIFFVFFSKIPKKNWLTMAEMRSFSPEITNQVLSEILPISRSTFQAIMGQSIQERTK